MMSKYHTKEKKTMTEIFDAIYYENFEEVKRIVNEDPKCVHIKDHICKWWTPFDYAIAFGRSLEMVQYLWKKGGRPNLKIYHRKETPVNYATQNVESNGNFATLKWVFENKVLPLDTLNVKNEKKTTPLDVAIERDELETAKCLWEMGGRPNLDIYRDGICTIMHHAAENGYITTLKWAFAEKVFPLRVLEVKDNLQKTPLDCAIAEGKLEMAKYLWEMGGRPNLEIYYRDEKWTPVHCATRWGNTSTLKWAFTEKVLPLNVLNIKNDQKRTPLDEAIACGKLETAALFRRFMYMDPVFLAMQRAKRDYQCVLRRLPNELLDMVVDEVAARFYIKVVW